MTKYTAFRCPVDVLAKAKVKAQADRRSLSKYIVMLIDKATQDVKLPPGALKPVKARKPGRPRKS